MWVMLLCQGQRAVLASSLVEAGSFCFCCCTACARIAGPSAPTRFSYLCLPSSCLEGSHYRCLLLHPAFYLGSSGWRPFVSFLGPVSILYPEPSLWAQSCSFSAAAALEHLNSEPSLALSCLCLESSQTDFLSCAFGQKFQACRVTPYSVHFSSLIGLCMKYPPEPIHKELNIYSTQYLKNSWGKNKIKFRFNFQRFV